MRTIYKYPLEITDRQVVELPVGATPLSVAYVRGEVVLYCAVDLDRTKTLEYIVNIYGTGRPIPEYPGMFLGSVVTEGGTFVWHIFIEV